MAEANCVATAASTTSAGPKHIVHARISKMVGGVKVYTKANSKELPISLEPEVTANHEPREVEAANSGSKPKPKPRPIRAAVEVLKKELASENRQREELSHW